MTSQRDTLDIKDWTPEQCIIWLARQERDCSGVGKVLLYPMLRQNCPNTDIYTHGHGQHNEHIYCSPCQNRGWVPVMDLAILLDAWEWTEILHRSSWSCKASSILSVSSSGGAQVRCQDCDAVWLSVYFSALSASGSVKRKPLDAASRAMVKAVRAQME